MAREPSITPEQVAAVAAEIKASGGKPTIRAVREALGGIGSMTTIQRYLQRWHDAQPTTAAAPIEIPAVVLTGIRQAIEHASSSAQAELRAELAEARETVDAITAEAERTVKALDDADAQIIALEALRADLAARLDEEKRSRQDAAARAAAEAEGLRADITAERQAAEAARVELAKVQLRLESLPRIEADLADARAELAQARDRAQVAERELAAVRAELAAARETIERERQAAASVQAHAEAEIRQARETSERAVARVDAELAAAREAQARAEVRADAERQRWVSLVAKRAGTDGVDNPLPVGR